MKQTSAPPMKALKTSLKTDSLLLGIRVVSEDITIPIEPGLEKPQMA